MAKATEKNAKDRFKRSARAIVRSKDVVPDREEGNCDT
jgi:hypothetical protein